MSHGFDLAAIRAQFPALGTKVHGGKPLLYLDSGASAQKPDCVIDCMVRQMQECYANVHRGAHSCSERTTLAYEQARERVARFLNAGSDEIVFTGSTTGSINLVAHAYGRGVLQPGDEVITSLMEHHSNFVPWQQLRDDHG
ncbi:MAG: aminotransferase class V-fold PLP-dependent enzyme, partial [Pseudomonadota bacterium]